MKKINEIIRSSEILKPLSPTTVRLAEIIENDESTINDIVEVIKYDQALTADVIKYSNSAAIAASREITSIKDAIVRIGRRRIMKDIVARHIVENCNGSLPGYGYSENELFKHSVAAASAAEDIDRIAGNNESGVSFIAALLHDIGKLIIERSASPRDMKNIWELVAGNNGEQTFEKAERKVLGFSHSDVGAGVVESWNFPIRIVNAVREHHSCVKTSDPIVDIVRISNYVARSIGAGIGYEGMSFDADSGAMERLGLNRKSFEMLCAETLNRYGKILEEYNID